MGTPYVVSKLITEFCVKNKLEVKDAIELLTSISHQLWDLDACDAEDCVLESYSNLQLTQVVCFCPDCKKESLVVSVEDSGNCPDEFGVNH